MSNQNAADVNAAKGRKMFLLLALVFVLPFTLAYTLHLLDIRPSGESVGNLVAPVVALEAPALLDAQGETFTTDRWQKIWSIVMVDAASCSESCEQNVDKLNRVHRTLYKDVDRIQRVLILKEDIDAARVQQLQEKFPKLIILSANTPEQQAFVSAFDQAAPAGSIYLVDPHSNLMMHYPQSVESKGLRKDIKKLLKTSWSG